MQPIVGHLFVFLTEGGSDSVFGAADTDFLFYSFLSLGWLIFLDVTRPRRSRCLSTQSLEDVENIF